MIIRAVLHMCLDQEPTRLTPGWVINIKSWVNWRLHSPLMNNSYLIRPAQIPERSSEELQFNPLKLALSVRIRSLNHLHPVDSIYHSFQNISHVFIISNVPRLTFQSDLNNAINIKLSKYAYDEWERIVSTTVASGSRNSIDFLHSGTVF